MAAGTLLARDVLLKAQRILNDIQGVQWEFDELIDWLNAGQRQIILLRPDASSELKVMVLQPGTKQVVPVGTVRLLDVVRNANDRAITYTDRANLDDQIPNWHQATPNVVVRHWTYDDRIPETFFVYPPQPTSPGSIEITRSVLPQNCTLDKVNGASEDSTIGIGDVFEGALIDYCVYRAYSKDASYTVRGGKADISWGRFTQSLGMQLQTDRRWAPGANTPPHRASPMTRRGYAGNTGAFDT